MNERGASLTELLAVMSIITIMCVLTGPQWLALAGRLDGRGVTAEIVGELRLARQLAIARQERIRVVLDGERAVMRTELHDGLSTLLRDSSLRGEGLSRILKRRPADLCFSQKGVALRLRSC